MSIATDSVKVVILLGGPSKGTRFRPLTLHTPKPLISIAGTKLVSNHIRAAASLENLIEILLIGFYSPEIMNCYIPEISAELGVKIRYLKEPNTGLGTAGGLHKFRTDVVAGQPKYTFVLQADILCDFPLKEMLNFQFTHPDAVTLVGKKIPQVEAKLYGCIVKEPTTNKVMHYMEKPERLESDLVSCGIYLFETASLFSQIDVAIQNLPNSQLDTDQLFEIDDEIKLSLEKHLLIPACEQSKLFVYETEDWWIPLKMAADCIECNRFLLDRISHNKMKGTLATPSPRSPSLKGNNFIHPNAQVDPTAIIGPNVSIGARVKIGPGVRIKESIIFEGSEIKAHACVLFSIICSDCLVGEWARIEGIWDSKKRNSGLTILGHDTTVMPEMMLCSCIVLPHKQLSSSYSDEIIL